jgi:hypothetical protein
LSDEVDETDRVLYGNSFLVAPDAYQNIQWKGDARLLYSHSDKDKLKNVSEKTHQFLTVLSKEDAAIFRVETNKGHWYHRYTWNGLEVCEEIINGKSYDFSKVNHTSAGVI